MIPKLIHQTAKTSSLPPDCVEYVEALKKLHPDWVYKLWTDADNLAFVKQEFPEFLEVFCSLPKNIMRADVIRYLIMYRLGGLYLDTDYEMLKGFDLCDQDIVLCWEGAPDNHSRQNKIANAIFASSPGHPFFKLLIDELSAHPPATADADVEDTTGPGLVTRIYRCAAAQGMKLFATEPLVFSPLSPRNSKEYRAICENGVSYGIHHCHGSWRQYTKYQRFRMKVASLFHGMQLGF